MLSPTNPPPTLYACATNTAVCLPCTVLVEGRPQCLPLFLPSPSFCPPRSCYGTLWTCGRCMLTCRRSPRQRRGYTRSYSISPNCRRQQQRRMRAGRQVQILYAAGLSEPGVGMHADAPLSPLQRLLAMGGEVICEVVTTSAVHRVVHTAALLDLLSWTCWWTSAGGSPRSPSRAILVHTTSFEGHADRGWGQTACPAASQSFCPHLPGYCHRPRRHHQHRHPRGTLPRGTGQAKSRPATPSVTI